MILHDAKIPESDERQDIKIPLDKHGRMLINWIHSNYYNSFRHVPVYMLYNLDLAEKLILDNLLKIQEADLQKKMRTTFSTRLISRTNTKPL